MRNGTQTQAHDPSQADHNRDNVYNLDEHGDDRRYKHQWLDRLQDADPPRHSILAIAYALTRFAVKTPRKFFGRIQIVADRAHVARSQAKVDLKWMHDNGWLVFGELTTEELQTLKVSDSEDLRVRVITIPAGNSARPPVEPQRTSSPRGGRPVGHGVGRPVGHPQAARLATESQSQSPISESEGAHPEGRSPRGDRCRLLLSTDWHLAPGEIAFANAKGWDAAVEFEKFSDYHVAQDTAARPFAGWSALWRAWIRRCDQYGGAKYTPPPAIPIDAKEARRLAAIADARAAGYQV